MTWRRSTIVDSDYASGGLGSMAELGADRIEEYYRDRPVALAGLPQCRGSTAALNSSDEWLQSGTGWSAVLTTDAFDKAPLGLAVKNQSGTSTSIQQWTKPTQWRPIVAYDVSIVDVNFGAQNGTDFQVREDGGTWFNVNQTLLHDNVVSTPRGPRRPNLELRRAARG